MRKPIIAGNWKMNNTASEGVALVKAIAPLVKEANCDVVVCVPAIDIPAVSEALKGTNIELGAENVHFAEKGAYTGEISAAMLKEYGVKYVIIGHSERRQYFGETDETVNKRTLTAIAAGLTPIVCIGESLEEREGGKTEEVLAKQIHEGLKNIEDITKIVIAYEPVWAIGTGKTATAEQANETIGFIRKTVGEMFCEKCAAKLRIQYGGSMNAGNCKELMAMPEIDAVVIMASWESHLNLACDAMRAGKYTAVEVAGAYSVEDCWKLVRTHEETGVPCMMLENCCFGRDELMVLNMVRRGLFGEVVHCQGGYRHDLREEVSTGREMRHYRFRNYLYRNCENYPTHELGPIANVLDINRGNRMLTLVSVASKAAGLHEYLLREKGPDYDAANMNFAQGDVVTTIIKCARGETICLTLDTTLPRAYSRGFHVQGTKGMYMEDNKSVFLDGKDNEYDFKWNERWNSAEEYREQYDHPVWKKYLAEGVRGGHDGMDWLVFRSFFDAAKAGAPAPIDVYDAAAWMSISCLSEQSVAMGGAPVPIPDFTNGMWMERAPWQP